MTKAVYNDYRESAAYIAERIGSAPDIAVILGSGLGEFAERLADKIVIPYREIPHFPTSTVSYQKGELVYGKICYDDGSEKTVLAMNGRFHYYEGWEMWQTAYPIGVFKLLGIDKMIITNAAGGIGYNDDREIVPGDLVCVTDQIKLSPMSPMRGANIPEFGERFFDMQSVFDKELRELAKACAKNRGYELKEGVYAYMTGPQYETPAEIRALKLMGANLVGMSTVAEVIFAAQVGIKVLCISCVSNMAAGITGNPLTEQEVLDTAAMISERFKMLLSDVIHNI
ncbi:MAG: purine-nucleoside phosphorylase [Clostridia bacterium]|nr:purine-nucleoside phosphorylase [Clostridia bacterium]